jgi:hypothetical protein
MKNEKKSTQFHFEFEKRENVKIFKFIQISLF